MIQNGKNTNLRRAHRQETIQKLCSQCTERNCPKIRKGLHIISISGKDGSYVRSAISPTSIFAISTFALYICLFGTLQLRHSCYFHEHEKYLFPSTKGKDSGYISCLCIFLHFSAFTNPSILDCLVWHLQHEHAAPLVNSNTYPQKYRFVEQIPAQLLPWTLKYFHSKINRYI